MIESPKHYKRLSNLDVPLNPKVPKKGYETISFFLFLSFLNYKVSLLMHKVRKWWCFSGRISRLLPKNIKSAIYVVHLHFVTSSEIINGQEQLTGAENFKLCQPHNAQPWWLINERPLSQNRLSFISFIDISSFH